VEPVEVEVYAHSTAGPIRSRNEDHVGLVTLGDATSAVVPVSERPFGSASVCGPGVAVAVADGLGGHAGGHLASRYAIRTLIDALAVRGTRERIPGLVRSVYEQANATLLAGDLRDDEPTATDEPQPRYRDAQTTLTALVVTSHEVHVTHVGDCRLYRLRDGMLDQLTRDHSQAMELLRMRVIRPHQVQQHPGRHLLTRSVGGDIAVRVDVRSVPVEVGDAYLICSDGLWSSTTDGEISTALQGDLEQGVEGLLQRSLERDGEDNASVIALRVRALRHEGSSNGNGPRLPFFRRTSS
jgi:serine/threonine protein phosphatase PrpC